MVLIFLYVGLLWVVFGNRAVIQPKHAPLSSSHDVPIQSWPSARLTLRVLRLDILVLIGACCMHICTYARMHVCTYALSHTVPVALLSSNRNMFRHFCTLTRDQSQSLKGSYKSLPPLRSGWRTIYLEGPFRRRTKSSPSVMPWIDNPLTLLTFPALLIIIPLISTLWTKLLCRKHFPRVYQTMGSVIHSAPASPACHQKHHIPLDLTQSPL
jgi:hypothetical protein